MYGWMGKVIRINLNNKEITIEELDKKLSEEYIGGRGFGTKVIFEEVPADTDPLGPENKLVFAVGPLTRTKVPTSGRFSLSTKSPLTNTIFDANAGGFWGPVFKSAGYDMLIIEGQAETPVHIVIDNDEISIRDGRTLWGKGIQDTDKLLTTSLGKGYQHMAIGPAGENLVKIATISVNAHRALGRGGVGAVMGSKKVKAISVKGNKQPEINAPEKFQFMMYETDKWIKANPLTSRAFPAFGTSVLVNLINDAGALPTRNFQQTQFEDADKISGEAIAKKILVKNDACYNCPLRCSRKTRTSKMEGYGPEYETVGLMGSNLGISDIEAIAEMHYISNDLGIDTISTGGTISCLMEMSERGLIDYQINFGDIEKTKELMYKIAHREGIGDELAEGSKRFAENYGAVQYAMQVKGLELPAYDPRGMKGRGLGYATSNRGACHLRGYMIGPEILGVPKMLDRFSPVGKSGFLINQQDFFAVVDSLVICKFVTLAVGEEFFARLFSTVTGVERSQQDLLDTGERIWTLERIYNLKAGFTKDDDVLPRRFLEEKGTGPAANQVFEQDIMLREYYRSRGWDENGVPTSAKLKELGLEGVDVNVRTV